MNELLAPMRKHRLPIALAVVFALIVLPAIGWFAWQVSVYYREIKGGNISTISERRLEASISKLVANTNVTQADLARLVPIGVAPELGSRTAKVTVVEFVDYQCPFCQKAAPVLRHVAAAMGDKVRFIIRDFPLTDLHPTAVQSAHAAHCVLAQGQDQYWRYHDLLFADIERQSADELRSKAQLVGARLSDYDACMAQNRFAKTINESIEAGLRAGVQGTPTFFVNGIRLQGALDEKTLTRVVNAVLEQQPK